MTTIGTVRTWTDDDGWGVVDSPETPGGCWAHFSSVLVRGYRRLHTGQRVHLEWEPVRQDGYSYRAVRTWPVGSEPVDDGDTDGRFPAPPASIRDDSEGTHRRLFPGS